MSESIIFMSLFDFLVLNCVQNSNITSLFQRIKIYITHYKYKHIIDLLTHFFEFRICCGFSVINFQQWIHFVRMHSSFCLIATRVGWLVCYRSHLNNWNWKAWVFGRDSSFLTLVHVCVLFWLISLFGVENCCKFWTQKKWIHEHRT